MAKRKKVDLKPAREYDSSLVDKIVFFFDKFNGDLGRVCDELNLKSHIVRNEWLSKDKELRMRLQEVLERKTDKVLSELLSRAEEKDSAAKLWVSLYCRGNFGISRRLSAVESEESSEEGDIDGDMDKALDRILGEIDE